MDQAVILRKMTGEKRLEQAILLSDLVREFSVKNIMANGIRSKKAIQRELQKRMVKA